MAGIYSNVFESLLSRLSCEKKGGLGCPLRIPPTLTFVDGAPAGFYYTSAKRGVVMRQEATAIMVSSIDGILKFSDNSATPKDDKASAAAVRFRSSKGVTVEIIDAKRVDEISKLTTIDLVPYLCIQGYVGGGRVGMRSTYEVEYQRQSKPKVPKPSSSSSSSPSITVWKLFQRPVKGRSAAMIKERVHCNLLEVKVELENTLRKAVQFLERFRMIIVEALTIEFLYDNLGNPWAININVFEYRQRKVKSREANDGKRENSPNDTTKAYHLLEEVQRKQGDIKARPQSAGGYRLAIPEAIVEASTLKEPSIQSTEPAETSVVSGKAISRSDPSAWDTGEQASKSLSTPFEESRTLQSRDVTKSSISQQRASTRLPSAKSSLPTKKAKNVICDICGSRYREDFMESSRYTLHYVLSLISHRRNRGIKEDSFGRVERMASGASSSKLYSNVKVCRGCYEVLWLEHELLEVEDKVAEACADPSLGGVPLSFQERAEGLSDTAIYALTVQALEVSDESYKRGGPLLPLPYLDSLYLTYDLLGQSHRIPFFQEDKKLRLPGGLGIDEGELGECRDAQTGGLSLAKLGEFVQRGTAAPASHVHFFFATSEGINSFLSSFSKLELHLHVQETYEKSYHLGDNAIDTSSFQKRATLFALRKVPFGSLRLYSEGMKIEKVSEAKEQRKHNMGSLSSPSRSPQRFLSSMEDAEMDGSCEDEHPGDISAMREAIKRELREKDLGESMRGYGSQTTGSVAEGDHGVDERVISLSVNVLVQLVRLKTLPVKVASMVLCRPWTSLHILSRPFVMNRVPPEGWDPLNVAMLEEARDVNREKIIRAAQQEKKPKRQTRTALSSAMKRRAWDDKVEMLSSGGNKEAVSQLSSAQGQGAKEASSEARGAEVLDQSLDKIDEAELGIFEDDGEAIGEQDRFSLIESPKKKALQQNVESGKERQRRARPKSAVAAVAASSKPSKVPRETVASATRARKTVASASKQGGRRVPRSAPPLQRKVATASSKASQLQLQKETEKKLNESRPKIDGMPRVSRPRDATSRLHNLEQSINASKGRIQSAPTYLRKASSRGNKAQKTDSKVKGKERLGDTTDTLATSEAFREGSASSALSILEKEREKLGVSEKDLERYVREDRSLRLIAFGADPDEDLGSGEGSREVDERKREAARKLGFPSSHEEWARRVREDAVRADEEVAEVERELGLTMTTSTSDKGHFSRQSPPKQTTATTETKHIELGLEDAPDPFLDYIRKKRNGTSGSAEREDPFLDYLRRQRDKSREHMSAVSEGSLLSLNPVFGSSNGWRQTVESKEKGKKGSPTAKKEIPTNYPFRSTGEVGDRLRSIYDDLNKVKDEEPFAPHSSLHSPSILSRSLQEVERVEQARDLGSLQGEENRSVADDGVGVEARMEALLKRLELPASSNATSPCDQRVFTSPSRGFSSERSERGAAQPRLASIRENFEEDEGDRKHTSPLHEHSRPSELVPPFEQDSPVLSSSSGYKIRSDSNSEVGGPSQRTTYSVQQPLLSLSSSPGDSNTAPRRNDRETTYGRPVAKSSLSELGLPEWMLRDIQELEERGILN